MNSEENRRVLLEALAMERKGRRIQMYGLCLLLVLALVCAFAKQTWLLFVLLALVPVVLWAGKRTMIRAGELITAQNRKIREETCR